MLRALISSLALVATSLAQTNFPPPPAPAANPFTRHKALLGMALFFEEQMSSTATVACATCHDLRHGGVDPRSHAAINPGPDGLFGTDDDIHGSPGVARISNAGAILGHASYGVLPQVTPRRSPTVINSGYQPVLGYDGSKNSLEALLQVPPVNTVEMGVGGRTWTDVEDAIIAATPLRLATDLPPRLSSFVAGHTYPDLFEIAFGTPQVTRIRIVSALATYLRTLNSDQSRWDRYQNGQAQLSPLEHQGLALFTTPAQGAVSCHTCHSDFDPRVRDEGPIVGQMTMQTTIPYYGSPFSFPIRLLFHNIGIRPASEDIGVQAVTNSPANAGMFRVQSLRNIELAGPYFHNGSAATLRDVIDFYDRGGDFHANQSPSLTQRFYSTGQKSALVALLQTLTDPRVRAGEYPFDQPTLGAQNGNLVQEYGRGMPTYFGHTLLATAPFAPRLGESQFRIMLSGATPGVFTILMWDAAPNNGPMPLGLSLAGSSAFRWYAMGVAAAPNTMPGNGVVEAPLPLPNDPGLRNVVLYSQWLTLEPSGTWPTSTSNALRIELQ